MSVLVTPGAGSAPQPGDFVEFPVMFVPQVALAKVAGVKRVRNARIVSLVISLGITFAIYWFFRDQLGDLTWPVLVLSVSLSLLYLVWAIVREVLARREASVVKDGLALGIGRSGLLLHTGPLPWTEVVALRAVPRRFGRSPDLTIAARSGAVVALPLAYLSALPATVDGAVKALSGGRHRVDFADLDA